MNTMGIGHAAFKVINETEVNPTEPSLIDLVEQLQGNYWVKLSNQTRKELRTKHRCPACERQTDTFVTHHWYESIGGKDYSIDICPSCNSQLSTKNFYEPRYYKEHKDSLHHVLPPWDKQLEWLRECIAPPEDGFIVAEYRDNSITRLPSNTDDWDGRRYQITFDFSNLAEAKRCLDTLSDTLSGWHLGIDGNIKTYQEILAKEDMTAEQAEQIMGVDEVKESLEVKDALQTLNLEHNKEG